MYSSAEVVAAAVALVGEAKRLASLGSAVAVELAFVADTFLVHSSTVAAVRNAAVAVGQLQRCTSSSWKDQTAVVAVVPYIDVAEIHIPFAAVGILVAFVVDVGVDAAVVVVHADFAFSSALPPPNMLTSFGLPAEIDLVEPVAAPVAGLGVVVAAGHT